jgi:hypothetical protein
MVKKPSCQNLDKLICDIKLNNFPTEFEVEGGLHFIKD